jgi:hypothetical protein
MDRCFALIQALKIVPTHFKNIKKAALIQRKAAFKN